LVNGKCCPKVSHPQKLLFFLLCAAYNGHCEGSAPLTVSFYNQGLDPKDCAAQNGVSLPSDFKLSTGVSTSATTSGTGYPSMSTPTYTSANSTSTYKAMSTAKSYATGYTGTTSRPATTYPTGYNSTATSSGYGANNTTVATFTGAAQPNAVAAGGLIAVVGALGLVGNLI
jgi:hypothetical protein